MIENSTHSTKDLHGIIYYTMYKTIKADLYILYNIHSERYIIAMQQIVS